jgi:predicted phage tail protein
MYGGGGKFGQIILGAALIGAAFIPGLGQIAGVAVSSILFSAGASMALTGISQLFMKAPTVDKSSDPPASKYLGNNKNTTVIGTLITMAWGRIKLTGHWLSVQVDSNDLVTTSFPVTTS